MRHWNLVEQYYFSGCPGSERVPSTVVPVVPMVSSGVGRRRKVGTFARSARGARISVGQELEGYLHVNRVVASVLSWIFDLLWTWVTWWFSECCLVTLFLKESCWKGYQTKDGKGFFLFLQIAWGPLRFQFYRMRKFESFVWYLTEVLISRWKLFFRIK